MRSETMGLRLCGIAELPFWPVLNGSMTSAISVCWRLRISVAEALQGAADDRQRGQEGRVPVARDDLGAGRIGGQPELVEDLRLDVRVEERVGPDGPGDLAAAHALAGSEQALRDRAPAPRPSRRA